MRWEAWEFTNADENDLKNLHTHTHTRHVKAKQTGLHLLSTHQYHHQKRLYYYNSALYRVACGMTCWTSDVILKWNPSCSSCKKMWLWCHWCFTDCRLLLLSRSLSSSLWPAPVSELTVTWANHLTDRTFKGRVSAASWVIEAFESLVQLLDCFKSVTMHQQW